MKTTFKNVPREETTELRIIARQHLDALREALTTRTFESLNPVISHGAKGNSIEATRYVTTVQFSDSETVTLSESQVFFTFRDGVKTVTMELSNSGWVADLVKEVLKYRQGAN